jgi:hypothetical protein
VQSLCAQALVLALVLGVVVWSRLSLHRFKGGGAR